MKKLICERCRKETTGCLTMSWFNREMICGKCSEKEKRLFTRICGRNPVQGVRQAGDISTLLQF